jgi:branched-chain amino acid transport system ATP-binding protein
VLEVRDLSIRFGGLQALKDVSLSVNEFEIVGLIGPNGAGKTTAFNCITGFYKPDTGTVAYRGADVTREPPHKKAAMGFGRTFQNVGMVKSATALDNLKSAMHARAGYGALAGMVGASSSWQAEKQLAERADAILDMLGLQAVRDQRVGGQSYGTLKLLELGCALATDPDILLLDEPTSGMGPEESDQLGERLLDLRREFGLTMLVIEHHVPLVLRVCDHVYVLNFGQLLAEGPPSVIQTHPEVVAAYLGGSAPDALEQTVETDEDAELDAQLEHAVHEHDAPGSDGHHEQPDALDPPTDEIPVVPVAAADVPDQPLRPRRRRVPRVPSEGSEVVADAAAPDMTKTVLTPSQPRPRRTRKDQP